MMLEEVGNEAKLKEIFFVDTQIIFTQMIITIKSKCKFGVR